MDTDTHGSVNAGAIQTEHRAGMRRGPVVAGRGIHDAHVNESDTRIALPEQRLECLLLLSLRIELARGVQIAAGNVQQFGKEDHVRDWRRSLCEQRLQLVELGLGRIVALKPGGSFELHDCRVESAVLVVWRAEVVWMHASPSNHE